MLKSESKNDSRQPRDLFKNGQSDCPKKSKLTLSQGLLKSGDDEDDVDDEAL
jgi:hypothetical protein